MNTTRRLVQLKRIGPSRYATLDGRYQIERQDGTTQCDHPLCMTLHRRYHEIGNAGSWMHWMTYVAWHVWDNDIDDYVDRQLIEYETKRDAHEALTDHLGCS